MGVDTVNSQTFYLQARQSANVSWPMSLNPLGGNVGIGTTSPSYNLSISGTVGLQGNEEYLYFHSNYSVGNNARGKIRVVGSGGGSGYGGDLRFSTRKPTNVWNEDALTIDSSGNVGIGTVTPSTVLEVVGTITCTTLVETSSVSLKTNIKKLTSQTAKIAKLSPVSFNYKNNNKSSIGLIAEEVAKIYPELVEYENDRALGVNYSKLTSVLISAVNELAAEVAELKKQLNK